MAGSSNFKVFNESFAGAQSDADYLVETQRTGGLSAGLAKMAVHNKLFRQVSIMAAAIGAFIAGQGNTASDADLTALTSALTNSVVAVGVNNKSVQAIKTMPVDVSTRSVEVTRVGGDIFSLAVKDPSDASTLKTTTINRVDGDISTLVVSVGAQTITYTVNRTDGYISSITKGVA